MAAVAGLLALTLPNSAASASSLPSTGLALPFTKSYSTRPSHQTKKHLRSHPRRSSISLPLANSYGIQYNIDISLGSPPQPLSVQLDTGSSNFWVPHAHAAACADNGCYLGAYRPNKSSTYTYLNSNFYMGYYDPSDYDQGDYATDVLQLATHDLDNLTFGIAYTGADPTGVLGLSFTFEEEGPQYPTVLDALKNQGLIDRRAYSLFLNDLDTAAGTILFGAVDPARYTGPLVALPMQPDYSRNVTDLSVALTGVRVTGAGGGGSSWVITPANFSAVPACLDSGTWDLELPAAVADAIVAGMGGTYTALDGYVVPCAYARDHAHEVSFTFEFGGEGGARVDVPLSELMTDADFRFRDGDGEEACSLGIDPVDTEFGGIVLLGDSFLRSAYVVYDLERLEIAIAQARFDDGSGKDGEDGEKVVDIQPTSVTGGLPGVTSTATAPVDTLAFVSNTYYDASQVLSTLVPGTPTYDVGSATATATGGAVGVRWAGRMGGGWGWVSVSLMLVTLGLGVWL